MDRAGGGRTRRVAVVSVDRRVVCARLALFRADHAARRGPRMKRTQSYTRTADEELMSSPAPSSRSAQHDRPRKAAPARRAALLVALVSLACVILLSVGSSAFGAPPGVRAGAPSCAPPPPYVVVVDAGSTGCRAHVFRVVPDPSAPGASELHPAGDKIKLDVPLASFAGAPDAALADALLPMLDAAAERVPAGDRARVPLYVWATAGLRAIDADAQTTLWNAVARLAREKTPFLVADHHPDPHRAHFRTIEGEEEGFFAWLAVNRLSGVNLRAVAAGEPAAVAAALGALDVGGGSAQIVAPRRDALAALASRRKPSADVSIASLRDAVYVKSYLGYGATRVESRLKSEIAAAARSRGDATATYPCGFLGREEPAGSSATDGSPAVTLRGSGDFVACSRLVRGVVAARAREDGESLRAPRDVAGGAFVGVSLTYHLTGFLARAFPGELASFPTPTMREVGRLATRACATPWDRARVEFDGVDPNTSSERLPGRCFDAALVDALLGDAEGAADGDEGGFGFARDDARVTFVEKVDGNEVEWTAGAAMTLATPEPGCVGGGPRIRSKTLGVVALVAAAVALVGLMVGAMEADKAWRMARLGSWRNLSAAERAGVAGIKRGLSFSGAP